MPTALYVAEARGMRSAERRKVNVLEMKCSRSLVGVSQMDRVRNEDVRRRAGIEKESESRADQRVLRWFAHVKNCMKIKHYNNNNNNGLCSVRRRNLLCLKFIFPAITTTSGIKGCVEKWVTEVAT